MFKIGEKVVCIGNFTLDEWDIELGNIMPIKGEIYTIRKITGGFLAFDEIINPKYDYCEGVNEMHFNPEKFRKLDHKFSENLLAEICQSMKEEAILN